MTTELAQRLRLGEPGAFTQLLDEHGSMLYRVARHVTQHVQDAEDVVQECLVTAYARIDTLDDPSALTSWLRRMAINKALLRLRRRRREPIASFDDGDPLVAIGRAPLTAARAPLPEESVLRREAIRTLEAEVSRLPEGARLVYVLTEIEGLSYPETAALLELSQEAVRARLHRARTRLRDGLVDYFDDRRHPDRTDHDHPRSGIR